MNLIVTGPVTVAGFTVMGDIFHDETIPVKPEILAGQTEVEVFAMGRMFLEQASA